MLRAVNIALAVAAVLSAVGLYAIKHDTRRLDARVQADEKRLEQLESDIRVLRAERAHLARPDRIEKLARDIGLAPLDPAQIIKPDDLADLSPLRPSRSRP